MKTLLLLLSLFFIDIFSFASPITNLLERIDKGASKKFIIEQTKLSDKDFFELDQKDGKIIIRGNNYVSIATGLNWYLKYYAGIHLSWNGMTAKLPVTLPVVTKKKDMKVCCLTVMISITALSHIRWHSGTGRVGKKR